MSQRVLRSRIASSQLSAGIYALIALALAAESTVGSEGVGGNWPQWRGPTRDSKIAGSEVWPDDLAGLKRNWRVELGPGYSGPIVWGNRVFITETRDASDEIVRALDRREGRELWRASWKGSMSVPFFAKSNGDWIRSTPACDGESLFVAGMRDVLVCLDVATGATKWRVNFPDKLGTPVPAFGFVCSPLVSGDHVYVQAATGFVKLDKRTGEILWRTLNESGRMNSAFSSPIDATIKGVRQFVVQTRQKLAGVDPNTGDVLWSQVVPSFRGMNILTPTIYEDGVFTSSYKNKSFYYRIEKGESGYRVEEAWTSKRHGYMSSPVVIDGYAYLHLGNGRLSCINLKTGKVTWRSKRFGKYWSMVANGDRILALDERGELLLISANPREFKLLDRKAVSESEAWAHLVVCGGEVFVRDVNGISAFAWK